MFCTKCGNLSNGADAKFCVACGATLNASASDAALQPALRSNICWNCGAGKQPILGNCASCGANLAGQFEAHPPEQTQKSKRLYWIIPTIILLVGLVIWGFYQGVSSPNSAADYSVIDPQAGDSSAGDSSSSDNQALDSAPIVSSDNVVQSIYDALYNYGTETWDIDPFNDLVTGSSGVLLGGDCAIWVYPDAYTKNAAINSGTFDSMGGNYFWDDADPDWYGVVLVADESSTCAADAETALGWNLADFSPTN